MTDTPTPEAAQPSELAQATAALRAAVAAMTDLADELREIRPAVRRSIRGTWYALLAVVLVIAGGGFGFWRYRANACERGNDNRAASVDLAEVVVFETARDLEDPGAARERAQTVRARAARDPRLAQRDC